MDKSFFASSTSPIMKDGLNDDSITSAFTRLIRRGSVTRFGDFSPLWEKLKSLWQLLKGSFSI